MVVNLYIKWSNSEQYLSVEQARESALTIRLSLENSVHYFQVICHETLIIYLAVLRQRSVRLKDSGYKSKRGKSRQCGKRIDFLRDRYNQIRSDKVSFRSRFKNCTAYEILISPPLRTRCEHLHSGRIKTDKCHGNLFSLRNENGMVGCWRSNIPKHVGNLSKSDSWFKNNNSTILPYNLF